MSTPQPTPDADDVTITKATRRRLRRVGDPTRTATLRDRFQRDFRARLRAVRNDITETLVENDALAFDSNPTSTSAAGTAHRGQWRGGAASAAGSADPDDRLHVESFGVTMEQPATAQVRVQEWLEAVLATRLGTEIPGGREGALDGKAWHAKYIREAYTRGIALANADMRAAGNAIDPDIDPYGESGADTLGDLNINADDDDDTSGHEFGSGGRRTLTLTELLSLGIDPSDAAAVTEHQEQLSQEYLAVTVDVQTAVDAIESDLARTLGDYIFYRSDRDNSRQAVASALTERIGIVGDTRLGATAATRVVAAVNQAVIQQGTLLGAKMLGVVPEADVSGEKTHGVLATAGDSLVCEQCAALEGITATVADIRRGDVPRPVYDTHPNCRCRWIILR